MASVITRSMPTRPQDVARSLSQAVSKLSKKPKTRAGMIRAGFDSHSSVSPHPTSASRNRLKRPKRGTNSTVKRTPTKTCPTRLGEKSTSRKKPFILSRRELRSNARPRASGNCTNTDAAA